MNENKYELRPLVATDMGLICKIINAIGARQLKECFNLEDFSGEINVEKIGISITFDIAGIVIANMSKAEGDIQIFLASLTGKTKEEIASMPFAEYGELIIAVVMKEDFRDFFKRVMKLFNQ